MNKLTTKQQIIALVAVLVLLLLAFYMLAWSPQKAALDDLYKQRAEAEKSLDAAKNTLIMMGQVKKNMAEAEVTLIKITNKIPAEPSLPALIVELQAIANDAGVDLQTLSPATPVSQGEYSEIQINASITGSYSALIDFLRRIENASRALKVSQIDVKVVSYPDLGLSLTVSAFAMGASDSSATPPSQTASAQPSAESQANVAGQAGAQPDATQQGNVATN